MAKKIVGFIKLQVPAGKANPSPPIGPALAQGRTNGGGRIGFTSWHLQLDEADDFLRH